jgi:predicted P-loop ATPase
MARWLRRGGRDRDQIWAEAVVRYTGNEEWWIKDEALRKLAEAEQEARFELDAWDGPVMEYANGRVKGKKDAWVTAQEVIETAIGKSREHWTNGSQRRDKTAAFLPVLLLK